MGRRHKRPTTERRTVRLDIESLEIAKGHDGFLRGEPEPVIVVGIYTAKAIVARGVIRFEQPERIPSSVGACVHEVKAEFAVAGGDAFFAIVCALEEDDGRGVARAYELLADPAALSCWRSDGDPDPVPIALGDTAPVSIELLAGARSFVAETAGDDWVGAAFVPIARAWSNLRVRFRSATNDWTALVSARA